MKTVAAKIVAIFRSQSCLYGIERFDHNTSCGSGAISVTHNIGFGN
uniref:CSC1-like protein RXW8 isoform X3 n=1 Tax=Rhizophora mucronata TaxID=61149 RepID=A0A2P2K500_RHIMU